MNKVFVTGASGFIGRRLVRALEENKVSISVMSRSMHTSFETVICDLKSESIPGDALNGVNVVFHLAGFTHDMRDASKVKHLYQKINVDATIELAKLAVQSGVKRFVFVSSVKAGGGAVDGLCMTEVDQGEPEGIYGKTKREAELKLLEIGRQSGMFVSIVRPSLVYGPNVKGNLRSMLSGIEQGWFPPLPEIGNKRSMIHVDDLVRAILFVANNDRANGEIFIATDGVMHSSREIYNSLCSALGKSIPKWSVPKFLFDLLLLINPHIKYKLNKLLGDECYSSAKLEELEFKSLKTLNDINETDF